MTAPATARELRELAVERLAAEDVDFAFLTDMDIGAAETPPVVYVALARRGGWACVIAIDRAEWSSVDPLKTQLLALLGFAPARAPSAMRRARRKLSTVATAKA